MRPNMPTIATKEAQPMTTTLLLYSHLASANDELYFIVTVYAAEAHDPMESLSPKKGLSG